MTNTKSFQQQLLFLINKVEKIEDLCKKEIEESFGPLSALNALKETHNSEIDYKQILEDSKKLTYTDGLEAGVYYIASKILRVLYL